MLDRLKLLANKRDVPYQSLLKMFVPERLKAEFDAAKRPRNDVGARPRDHCLTSSTKQ